jgi:hypothetical protein
LLLTDHVAYWLTRSEPPSGFVTHPSTLSRDQVLEVMGTTPTRELSRIFQSAPEFVILDPSDWFLEGETRAWLEARLASDYVEGETIAGRAIYRRRADVPRG